MNEEPLVLSGSVWEQLTGIPLTIDDVARIKYYLNSTRSDDLVYLPTNIPMVSVLGGDGRERVKARLALVGGEGMGAYLRLSAFEDQQATADTASMALYLCQVSTDSDGEVRFVYLDFRPLVERRYLACKRERADALLEVLRRMPTGKGQYWVGSRELSHEVVTSLDESRFRFSDRVLSIAIENTVGFLANATFERYQELGISPKRGLLLYGPPGTGKTVLVKILSKHAIESGVNVVHFDSASIREMDYQFTRGLRSAMRQSPVVIVLDDLDLFCRARGHRQKGSGVLPDLLECLDGMETADGYAIVATSNDLGCLDRALRRAGRFDVHLRLALPTSAMCCDVLPTMLRLDAVVVPESSKPNLEGLSYADLAEVCRRYKFSFLAHAEKEYFWDGNEFQKQLRSFLAERAEEEQQLQSSGNQEDSGSSG